jgi:hypothetical protein
MTWIRLEGEREFIDLLHLGEKEGLLRLGESYLVMLQSHPNPCKVCRSFCIDLLQALDNTASLKANLLIAADSPLQGMLPERPEIIPLPPRLPFANRIQKSLAEFSFDVSILLFDPYGSLWFAWVGDELDAPSLAKETVRWLSYLDIQCPE